MIRDVQDGHGVLLPSASAFELAQYKLQLGWSPLIALNPCDSPFILFFFS